MSTLLMFAAATTMLRLAIDPAAPIPPDVSVGIVAKEVRAIWQPHADIVITKDRVDACDRCGHTLTLHFSNVPPPSGPNPEEALGWIEFIDGRPEPDLAISVVRARRLLADAIWMGRRFQTLPSDVRTRLLSTTIARALAHEIGHYILRSPTHQPDGLMRARFTVRDFLETGTRRFRLTPIDEARLLVASAAPALSRSVQ